MSLSSRTKGILFASASSLLWGLQVIVLKIATGIADPVNIIWFRFSVAFALLFTFYMIARPSSLKILLRPPIYLIFAALGLVGNYLAFLLGVRLISPSNAQVIIQLAPLLLGLAGIIFYKEKITRLQMAGFVLAGGGLTWFYHENLSNMLENRQFYIIGVIWIVVSACSWVVYAIFQKNLVRRYPTQQLNLVIFGLPLLLLLPFVDFADYYRLSAKQYIPLLYLGMTTLLAYGSMALAFKYLEANKISVIVAVNPVITFLVMGLLNAMQAGWIQPEHFTVWGVLAALVVIGGAVLAVSQGKRPNNKVSGGWR